MLVQYDFLIFLLFFIKVKTKINEQNKCFTPNILTQKT